MQRPDGGWASNHESGSDAFATTQALYMLLWAGLSHDQPSIERGLCWLLREQYRDIAISRWLLAGAIVRLSSPAAF
ncbi:MAG: hypothetical protein SNJ82_14550 [Gemmataceae bacterium]